MTPHLKTNRLTLSPPFIHEGMDVSRYIGWLQDERVVKYSEQRHNSHNNDTQYEYLLSFDGENSHLWNIFVGGTTPIGTISAHRDIPNRTANVGIMIGATSHWGRSYACEAWEVVCDWLFETDIRKCEAGCMASNTGMIRVLEKTGFVLEATIPAHFLFNGKPEDALYYGKTQEAKVIPIRSGGGR